MSGRWKQNMVKCQTAELEKLISFFKYWRDFSVYECFSKFSGPFLIIPLLAGHESSWNVFRTWQTCRRRKQEKNDVGEKRGTQLKRFRLRKWKMNERDWKWTISEKGMKKNSADVDRQDRHKRKQRREEGREGESNSLLSHSSLSPHTHFYTLLTHTRTHNSETMLVSVRKMSEIYELWKKVKKKKRRKFPRLISRFFPLSKKKP